MAFSIALHAIIVGVLLSSVRPTNAKCGGKTLLKELQGTISDGPSDYPENQRCEWLIEAPKDNMTITLDFIEYGTECTYDYLFIYDGPSYQSKLLGSFTGNNIPASIVASSGKMLVHLFSDTNYRLKGFKANYTIENCHRQCSGHGNCVNGQCNCNIHRRGKYCGLSWCPSNCNFDTNRGKCDLDNKHCTCSPGFAGEDCFLSLLTTDNTNAWYKMVTYSQLFTPRLGHAAVYDQKTDLIWSFGGFDLNSADNDLLKFNLTTGQWIQVSTAQPKPVGRYSHTASLYHNELFIFGGQFNDVHLTNELWKFNLNTLKWTQLNDSNGPPPLAMHTANIVGDKLYIFGGRTMNESSVSSIYKYDLSNSKTGWQRVRWKSGKAATHSVMGHSTVYDNDTRSLIVFGGFQLVHGRLSNRLNKLHAFHVDLLVWSQWDLKDNVPKPRAFHSASIVGDYMILFGGTVHEHHKDESCYDNELHFFHLKCHKWISLSDLAQLSPAPALSKKPKRGRYSHVAIAKGSTLLIFGGYSGEPLGDMYAYKVPISVFNSAVDKSGDHCNQYKTDKSCLTDPSCGWCSNSKCYALQDSSKCSSTWNTPSCPGLCGLNTMCMSCLSSGSNHLPNKCGWCVQDSRCYSLSSPQGACESPNPQNSKRIRGWWGTQGQFLSGSVDKCQEKNYPPGLIEITRMFPEVANYPDEISQGLTTETKILDSNFKKVKTSIGFVYPFKFSSSPYDPYRNFQIYMDKSSTQTSSKVHLHVSSDSDKNNQGSKVSCELIAKHNSGSCQNPGKYFPNPTKDQKYYIEIKSEKPLGLKSLTSRTSWNISNFIQLLDAQYLEPFSSGGSECSSKDSCMGCMTDASCGWCEITGQCLSRKLSNSCNHGGHSQYLVLNATQCTQCDDLKDCISCSQHKYCVWVTKFYRCRRKGISYNSPVVSKPESCSLQCERRESCSTCVADGYECAWCESTSSCFVFGSYIMQFPYGQCTRWVNGNEIKCQNCSMHTNCKACLSDIKCGWCGSTDNPLRGSCVNGDFVGPSVGNCSSAVNLNESVAWSYGRCPDVDECRLGLHNCHYNASCHNVYDSYNCICNRGFTGDGKTFCNKTCDPPCIHGVCKSDYTCVCDLGWKGINCSIDCGCNGHSTCNKGIGICDKCQDYTHGNYCEKCVPGSYGNATTKQGCKKCDCNGHGDLTKGECDNTTGVCFCNDNTMGSNCEQCLPGLVGNPKNGGRCYYECTTRSVLTNVTHGDISTVVGSGVVNPSKASCVWVISTSTNTSHNVVYGQTPSQPSISTVTLEFMSMNLSCLTDHVDVYDGLPYFILNVPPLQPPSFYKLGSFCGTGGPKLKHITSVTGSLVVIFQGDISEGASSSGFAATFKVNRCPDSCHGNRHCAVMSSGEECVCKEGWIGPDCSINMCPNNCSTDAGQGNCNKVLARCECNVGFTGLDCSKQIPPGKGLWDTLFTNSFPNSSYSEVPRFGHTIVAHSNYIWIYGGYSMAYGILDTIYRYDVIDNTMSHVITNQLPPTEPKGRFLHCAVLHQVSWFVYGGLTKDGASNEMWYFDVKLTKWSEETPNSGVSNPKVAGHTCTLVNNAITIIGGYDPMTGFNSEVYQYNIPGKSWSVMQPLKQGTNPTGLYGHTTVYHSSSQSLFVFGGYQFKVHEVKPSSDLYTLHLPSREWKLLQAMPSNQPMPKFFHSAEMVGDAMVVYGGRSSTSEQSSSELLVYKVNCNYWHTLSKQDSAVLGSSPGGIVSTASSSNNSIIFIFGGLVGQAKGSLHKFKLPSDLCQGMRVKNTCSSTPGCSWCEIHYSNSSSNQSYVQSTTCYSVTSSVPSSCHASSNVTQVLFVNGTQCNSATAQQRDCNTYTSCSSCLSSYPDSQSSSTRCNWCVQCSGGGKCIDKVKECDSTSSCGISSPKRTSPGSCPENTCEASKCKDCVSDNKCMWTPQLKWLNDIKVKESSSGVAFSWNCFERTLKDKYTSINLAYTGIAECPKSCAIHKDCRSCLAYTEGDGGWKECIWSESQGKCYSPSYLPMVELGGVAGRIVRGSPDKCMPPCAHHDRCSSCFSAYNCGWCSNPNSNGLGACMEGGVSGPLYGTCQGNTIDTGPQTPSNLSKKITISATPVWASVLCPVENECTNGRNNCSYTEDCIDTPESYKCLCKPGYKREWNVCVPICEGGCGHGVCVTPNNCSCNFGWTSRNCSIRCHCNNHGHCLSENSLDTCYDCRNNTKGKSCELCSPLFVGSATNNGSCISCYDVCNKSAYVCMGLDDLIRAQNQSLSLKYDDVAKWLNHGPTKISKDKECICLKNSKGLKCKSCIKGHFFPNDIFSSYCTPCLCNGHGDVCNDKTGNCECQNHTLADCSSGDDPCYKRQCYKCEDNYLGRPWDNRQCYSKVIHLTDFAISSKPGSVTEESSYPPLPKGMAISYVVYPRYTNVDIRTTIDVFQGGVDVYVSTHDRTFAVYVNKTTGQHTVVITREDRTRRSVDDLKGSPDITVFAGKNKLNTFVSLDSPTHIVRIKAVENRLVLTFPYSKHRLRSSRFYLMVMGVGDDSHDDTTGIIYFRQDLSQIDLFVFFSVFFSVFFLVLALCIVAWKVKQFHDRRRIAQVQERELESMASRPFATYSFLTDMKTAPQSCWKIKRDNSRRNLRDRKNHLLLKEASHRPFISPVALQSTEDTRAAVASVMFQLPRNENSDFQLAFGSVISANSNQHSIGSLFGYPLLTGHKTRHTTITS